MARFRKFAGRGGDSVWLDLDQVMLIESWGLGESRVTFLNESVVFVIGSADDVMRGRSPDQVRPPLPPIAGDEGEELAALREKVKSLEAKPDGFSDQRRRTEALKTARIYELHLLRQAARGASLTKSVMNIVAYVDERIAEIERGGF